MMCISYKNCQIDLQKKILQFDNNCLSFRHYDRSNGGVDLRAPCSIIALLNVRSLRRKKQNKNCECEGIFLAI